MKSVLPKTHQDSTHQVTNSGNYLKGQFYNSVVSCKPNNFVENFNIIVSKTS